MGKARAVDVGTDDNHTKGVGERASRFAPTIPLHINSDPNNVCATEEARNGPSYLYHVME